MYWTDEGYLLSKNNFDENSIIIEAFTLNHGKYSGIVYGGSSRKQKRNFQIGNKILLNWKSKGENRSGYFSIELINPIAPLFFDDKKIITCILSSASILKILLPERQINKKIYNSYEKMLIDLKTPNWIRSYIFWEISLIKELGYEINLHRESININNKNFKIPKIFLKKNNNIKNDLEISEALNFNKHLLLENFIEPSKLRFPLFRNILQNYYI
mgnify:CR=1 FL=1|jgi:DNA repair protein RecO (recombination protein O)